MIYHFIPDFILKIRESVFCGPYAMNQYSYIRHDLEIAASNMVKIIKIFLLSKSNWAKTLILNLPFTRWLKRLSNNLP